MTNLFKNQVILAPLAGITDSPFRQLVKSFGANLMYSEMISAEGLIRSERNTLSMLRFKEIERPLIIQLFGGKPESLELAVKHLLKFQPYAIDFNAGCPVTKVLKSNAGAQLTKDLPRLEKILKAMVKASENVPITVKLRLGWDAKSINILEACKLAEDCGVSAVAIHARTKAQGYSGSANWSYLKQVKDILNIPVIGSGDIWNTEQAALMFNSTGVDSVMVARGILGKPWLVKQIQSTLNNQMHFPDPDLAEIIQIAFRHLDLCIEHYGDRVGIPIMRKHLAWYIKTIPDAKSLRPKLVRVKNRNDIIKSFNEYFDHHQLNISINN